MDSSSRSPRPVWTAFAVCVASILLAGIVSGMVMIGAAVLDRGPQVLANTDELFRWMQQFGSTRFGLLVVLLPSQLVFLAVTLSAALLSPRPLVDRLHLGRGQLPVWNWCVFVMATPLVGLVSSQILSLFVTELSPSLMAIEAMLRAHAEKSIGTLLVLAALLPGFVEELIFRGYLQTRLVERWPATLAVLVSAVVFCAAHLDPMHAIGVLPLGVWLGTVAWRAGSVWPAILCHAANNVFATLGLRFQPAGEIGVQLDPFTGCTLLICIPAFLFSLLLMRKA